MGLENCPREAWQAPTISWLQISAALPSPMASEAGTVPLRRPRSCRQAHAKSIMIYGFTVLLPADSYCTGKDPHRMEEAWEMSASSARGMGHSPAACHSQSRRQCLTQWNRGIHLQGRHSARRVQRGIQECACLLLILGG